MVVVSVAVGQKTGCKHDDGIHPVTIVALIKTQGKEGEIKWPLSTIEGIIMNRFHYLIAPLFPLVLCNSFAHLSPSRPFPFRLFLLSTFRKSVISFFVLAPIHHHSRCHSIRGSFVEITKLGCFIEGSAFRLRWKSRVNKAFCLLLSGVWLKKKKKKNVLFRLMLHFRKILPFDWHEAQVCILGLPA